MSFLSFDLALVLAVYVDVYGTKRVVRNGLALQVQA
jgi:hypothetical protein